MKMTIKEISKIRHNDIGKELKTDGMIKRVTKVIPRIVSIKYICQVCGKSITIKQKSRKREPYPKNCSCGAKNKWKEEIEVQDIQEVNLEESPEGIANKQPQQIKIFVTGELTDPNFSERLQPGRKVEIIGLITQLPAFMNKSDNEENISEFMVNATKIEYLEEDDDIELGKEDIENIEKISKEDPLEKLANSLTPSIYGFEVVKKAIVLQLVKGIKKERQGGTWTRSDINILIVGDPGVAKTVILKSASIKCPKGKYVSGTRSTAVGLTAMVKRDELTGTFSAEAGAMVLASGSILCIDELDKIGKDEISRLYEPLESQTVTLTKAGINCTLKAETSILAAANPKEGKFDEYQTICSQIDIPPPLLNRFDLIFILIDKPNEEYDKKVVNTIFDLHSRQENVNKDIGINMFRKYICYAKKMQPKLKEDLRGEIEEMYLELRNKSKNNGQKEIPINSRNTEAIIRIAEANAKIRLSNWVEKEDIQIAKEILLYSLKQVGVDPKSGTYDLSRIDHTIPIGKLRILDKITKSLRETKEKEGKYLKIVKLKELIKQESVNEKEIEEYVKEMKRKVTIIEVDNEYIQII